jgi:hypothetical protein
MSYLSSVDGSLIPQNVSAQQNKVRYLGMPTDRWFCASDGRGCVRVRHARFAGSD